MKEKKFIKLTPFKMQVLQSFPFIDEDFDAITNYELLCKVVEYLNKTIDNVDLLNEKVEEFQTYFDNLDVQEEINNKLDEMVQDGSFDEILSNYSIGKETFRTKLYFNKLGRVNHTNEILNDYVSCQAGVYIGDNIYIYPMIKNNDTGDARLFKLNISTGNIIDTNDVTGLFHANGCCIKNNRLYYVQSFDNQNNPKYGIVEIDVQSLEVIDVHQIDFGEFNSNLIHAIGYDSQDDKFYLIAEDYFYKTDTSFVVESITAFKKPIPKTFIRQGGSFYNNYICFITNSENAILCFNKNGALHHVIDIGQYQVNNVFGEIENFNVINNKLYLISTLNHVNSSNLFLVQFFNADLAGGGLPQFNVNGIHYGVNTQLDIVVNKDAYDNLSSYNKFTCDGTSSKPYETLGEAIANLTGEYSYTINVTSSNTDFNQSIGLYKKDVTIKGNNCKVRSIKIVNSRVSLSSVIINHSDERSKMWGNTSESFNTPLYITYNSLVTLLGNTGFVYNNCVDDGMTNRYVIEGSILNDISAQIDASGTKTFTPKDIGDSNYPPMISYNSLINVNRSYGINVLTSRITDYKSLDATSGVKTVNLTTIPIYSNAYKGINVAINLPGMGNTDYHKLNYYNQSRNIVFESLNGRYLIVTQLNTTNNTMTFTPYKFNTSTNTFQRDDTYTFAPYYNTEI